MNPVDETTQELMLGYLQCNFPITRLKNGRRFTKGILFDGEKIFLKPREELKRTYTTLANVLDEVFNVSEYEINVACLRYLSII